MGAPLQPCCLPCAQPSDSVGASCSDQSFGGHFQPIFRRKMCDSSGWWDQRFAPAYSLGQSNPQLGQIQSQFLSCAVCKEEGPELPIRGSGRAGSCPINQHKDTPGRSFWPDLLMTFAVLRASGSQSLLARAGSVFPCTHNKGALQPAPALPLHWFSQAGDVFRGLIFNLHPTEEENL